MPRGHDGLHFWGGAHPETALDDFAQEARPGDGLPVYFERRSADREPPGKLTKSLSSMTCWPCILASSWRIRAPFLLRLHRLPRFKSQVELPLECPTHQSLLSRLALAPTRSSHSTRQSGNVTKWCNGLATKTRICILVISCICSP